MNVNPPVTPPPIMNPAVHILIVEDIAAEAFKLRHLLEEHYGQVSLARRGEEALQLIARNAPTLVISDSELPDMDGCELCRRIKTEPALARVPVILLTAFADPTAVVRGLECGASGFLSKPYDETHLLARIQFTLANLDLRCSEEAEAGVEFFFEGQKYFIASQREQILHFLFSTYDVALRKSEALAAATSALQAQARALERSNTELARSNDELAQFASVASHDLHEPLRMVTSYLSLLERRAGGKLDDKERQYIGFAMDGATRMQQMISDLLTYSRVSTRGTAPAQANLAEVLKNAIANLEVATADQHAKITHDPMPEAQVDSSQFTQLFQNLIGNALKFTSDRPPQVHVGCERRPGEWLFRISDNGIGIPRADFERIFQLFQRLHSRSEYPGTGIGLALCKKIVERHGGRIWVESEEGKGTTFFFTIPDGGRT
jgi:signal transduction histidine kinase